jgi:Fic family protein
LFLDYGPEWEDKEKRLERKNDYINKYKEKSYNVFTVKPIIMRPLLAQGKRFESVHEVVRNLNISRFTLKRYLKDPFKMDYFYLVREESSYGKIPFFL